MAFLQNPYVVFVLISITVFAVYVGLLAAFRKDPVRERLKRINPVLDAPGVGYSYDDEKSPLYRLALAAVSAVGGDVEKAKRELYLPLARAGLMSTDAVVVYLFFQRFVQPVLLLLAAFTFAQLFRIEHPSFFSVAPVLIAGGLLALFGLRGTAIYISNLTERRKQVLQRSFSDALDLLLVCVESGLPLDAALARVCREMKASHPVITEELDRLRIELSVLNDRVQALQNLADRTNTPGFRTLVSTLIQTEKVGSSISDTLRMLADEYRTTRMLNAENRAAKIPALITVPLVLFIMPAFMLILLGPPFIRIVENGGIFGPSIAGR